MADLIVVISNIRSCNCGGYQGMIESRGSLPAQQSQSKTMSITLPPSFDVTGIPSFSPTRPNSLSSFSTDDAWNQSTEGKLARTLRTTSGTNWVLPAPRGPWTQRLPKPSC